MQKDHTAAIILAAGSGKRMNSTTKKQYMVLDNKPLIFYALNVFQKSFIDELVLVVSPGDEDYCKKEIVDRYAFSKVSSIVAGGKERYHSVAAGLNEIQNCKYVFIHDGARPLITADILERSYEGVCAYGACVAGMPVKDTIKITDEQQYIRQTPDRRYIWTIQTPQTFEYALIKEAYDKLIAQEKKLEQTGIAVTDDAMAVEIFTGHAVKLIEGSYDNIKITTPEDLEFASAVLNRK